MSNYLAFPAPAKLNLELRVVGRRADGYHLLDTDFVFIDRADTVELALRDDGQVVLDNPIAGVPAESDLTVRAARLLKEASGCAQGVNIRLTKRIPMGGGLGGGSSDAATVLIALNRLWGCGLGRDALMALGVQLGADVPVFIFGRAARAQGIGEKLNEIKVPEAWYVVLKPPVNVPTADIFKNFAQRVLTGKTGFSIIRVLQTTQQKQNDLQSVVCEMYPVVNEALNNLAQYGSPLMTGSGSCVFLECGSQSQANKIFEAVSKKFDGFVAKGLQAHPLFDKV
ncbi:4-(cytidine 5'-diphospho)-2-C-methyl-D-erythritol kinase [Crenobacter caeni]|uniref:4-diphosphocytidyl-2-C-methyl-D-erythritol kinase n=1 Tax=Crenobacter caeni TaxID=2705474 RepID=A0A6B2KSP2_9NEIS|nr:4-(cytidine 5'-diphospho)-2-C-methyl-D-erythritol kinase [Crenobacter caeni]NDV13266.1 4-(cytidine 5'-diphospho)-2-C-methyl-D-erythritol kinase [Crenobacter caeni]